MRKKNKKSCANGKKDYDFKEDILYIFPIKRKYESSIQEGNLIFDLDKNKKVVGLEILEASKILGVSKSFLAYSFRGFIFIEVKEKKIEIRLKLTSKIRNQEKSIENQFENIHSDSLKPSLIECAVA